MDQPLGGMGTEKAPPPQPQTERILLAILSLLLLVGVAAAVVGLGQRFPARSPLAALPAMTGSDRLRSPEAESSSVSSGAAATPAGTGTPLDVPGETPVSRQELPHTGGTEDPLKIGDGLAFAQGEAPPAVEEAERGQAGEAGPTAQAGQAKENDRLGQTGGGDAAGAGPGAADKAGTTSRTLTTAGMAAPRLAVVIDDWGYQWPAARDILSLPFPLTAAVLPDAPYSREQARAAAAAGFQVILHMPMQPLAELPLSAMAIRVDESDREIRQQVLAALQVVPQAVGISNHQGSRATADSRVMRAVLQVAKEQGLFFLDSRTGPHSVVTRVAQQLGVPTVENALFIDNVDSVYSIMARLRQGAELARKHGQAVVIGHVHKATAQALHLMLPTLAQEGIQLVHVSELLPALPPSSAVTVPADPPAAVIQ
ncbi:MAG: divergent polysaccharide deacetylase family protein [Limnochordaceae bacterium]|nr:divergent polysaccharide deacetylase family protein [Limnochordaceae bacterium]